MTVPRLARTLSAAALAACLVAPAASAAPGDLDTTFSADGKTTVHFGTPDVPGAIAVQPDGKVLVGGSANGAFAISRLLPGGGLDTSFSGDGKLTTAMRTPTGVQSLLVLPDGRIMAAGILQATEEDYDTHLAAARYLPNGTLDSTYGSGGRFQDPPSAYGDSNGPNWVRFQPDGKMLLSGAWHESAGRWSGYVERRLPSGAYDGSHSPGCYCLFGGFGPATAQPDKKVVVVGDGGSQLLRYDPDLRPDGTFGGGDGAAGLSLWATDLLVQADGKIVAGGEHDGDLALQRVRGTGDADTSFGAGGRVTLDLGGDERLAQLARQPNGKLLALGTSGRDMVVVRLLANGQRDTAFGSNGVQRLSFHTSTSFSATGAALALQPDGKVLALGRTASTTASDFAIARLHGDPVPSCNGLRPTMASGAAWIIGSNARDVIVGGVGADHVKGGGGNDVVCGGTENDSLSGGDGDDLLFGEAGNDGLFGEAGADRLDGGAGTDRGDGGPGTDTAVSVESVVGVP